MTDTKEYEYSEAADIFPMMTGARFDDLVEDIREHGLLEPIELDADNKILDGRNRYEACLKAGVEPVATEVTLPAGMDAFQYVMSKNLTRRQLTPAQRAEVVHKLRDKGYSVRQIAKQIGQPKSTVQDDLKAASGTGQPEVEPEGWEDFDGAVKDMLTTLKELLKAAGSRKRPKATDYAGLAARVRIAIEEVTRAIGWANEEPKPEAKPEAEPKPADVRAWAKAEGMDVPERGRMPKKAIEAYAEAHAA